jgi:tRNA U34 5-methylaminomethyl-2-thiouridine-forming methyltransferase MnmC
MSDIQIITTTDGSHSLLNTALNETYHSVHGALQESRHVFIRHGLDFYCERSGGNGVVNIFEMGFGTGLNALLTAQRVAETGRPAHYTSLETFPLPEAVWRQLNYGDDAASKDLFRRIHEAPWSKDTVLPGGFTLLKQEGKLQEFELPPAAYDVIYYDAFAPSKQPELWDAVLFKKIAEAMEPGGVFVTYCAKGQVKRDLKSVGLTVETLPGPPGKKEMVRALKI